MIKSSIEKIAEDIGFDIGMSDDVTQANLINGLAKGLRNSMGDAALDTQLCYIADKLSSKSIEVIKALAGFIELKEKE